MNKKILSLILAIVMIASVLPVNALAVQSGITVAPTESGALKDQNYAIAHSLTGPMTLGGASAPAEVT